MIRTYFSNGWKSLIAALLLSFAGAFMGAAWIAYTAVRLGASTSLWVSVSGAGAALGCALIFSVLRPAQGLKHSR